MSWFCGHSDSQKQASLQKRSSASATTKVEIMRLPLFGVTARRGGNTSNGGGDVRSGSSSGSSLRRGHRHYFHHHYHHHHGWHIGHNSSDINNENKARKKNVLQELKQRRQKFRHTILSPHANTTTTTKGDGTTGSTKLSLLELLPKDLKRRVSSFLSVSDVINWTYTSKIILSETGLSPLDFCGGPVVGRKPNRRSVCLVRHKSWCRSRGNENGNGNGNDGGRVTAAATTRRVATARRDHRTDHGANTNTNANTNNGRRNIILGNILRNNNNNNNSIQHHLRRRQELPQQRQEHVSSNDSSSSSSSSFLVTPIPVWFPDRTHSIVVQFKYVAWGSEKVQFQLIRYTDGGGADGDSPNKHHKSNKMKKKRNDSISSEDMKKEKTHKNKNADTSTTSSTTGDFVVVAESKASIQHYGKISLSFHPETTRTTSINDDDNRNDINEQFFYKLCCKKGMKQELHVREVALAARVYGEPMTVVTTDDGTTVTRIISPRLSGSGCGSKTLSPHQKIGVGGGGVVVYDHTTSTTRSQSRSRVVPVSIL